MDTSQVIEKRAKHDSRGPVGTIHPQCTAKSKQTQNRCKKRPIRGSTVCKFHGGGSPQVRRKALERIVEMSAAQVLGELTHIGRSNMLDYMKIDPTGEPVVDFSKLTREQASAISEITIDDAGGGAGDGERKRVRRVRLKLWDKLKGLELVGKHQKLFTEKVELSLDEELLDRLAAGRKRLAELREGEPS